MASRRESDETALADRLVNYSDALVAVSFLGVSGIGIAIADPDIRCTIADGAGYIAWGNLANGVIFTALILLFRRWEAVLRADAPPSETVARYTRWIHLGRLVILWTSVVMASVLAYRAADEACAADFGVPDASAFPATEATEAAGAAAEGMDRPCELGLALVARGGSGSLVA
ncbi:MAG: hypothetical protein AAGC67_09635 [Myxococcota bacterium]